MSDTGAVPVPKGLGSIAATLAGGGGGGWRADARVGAEGKDALPDADDEEEDDAERSPCSR